MKQTSGKGLVGCPDSSPFEIRISRDNCMLPRQFYVLEDTMAPIKQPVAFWTPSEDAASCSYCKCFAYDIQQLLSLSSGVPNVRDSTSCTSIAHGWWISCYIITCVNMLLSLSSEVCNCISHMCLSLTDIFSLQKVWCLNYTGDVMSLNTDLFTQSKFCTYSGHVTQF